MMNRRLSIWIAGMMSIFLLSGCIAGVTNKDSVNDTTSPLAWIAGCWMTDNADIVEEWRIGASSLLFGYSVTLKGSIPVFFEQLRIETKDGMSTLFAYPAGQGPTAFPMLSQGERQIIFENTTNDYPQLIDYKRSDDTLIATIALADGSRAKTWVYQQCP